MAQHLSTQLRGSRRDHAFLEDLLLVRGGLATIDPETPVGKAIARMAQDFLDIASPERPELLRLEGARLCISALLIMRSADSQLLDLQLAVPIGQTKRDSAIRSAMKLLHEGKKSHVQLLLRGLQLLGVQGFADQAERAPDADRLARELEQAAAAARRKATADATVDAEFKEVRGGGEDPDDGSGQSGAPAVA